MSTNSHFARVIPFLLLSACAADPCVLNGYVVGSSIDHGTGTIVVSDFDDAFTSGGFSILENNDLVMSQFLFTSSEPTVTATITCQAAHAALIAASRPVSFPSLCAGGVAQLAVQSPALDPQLPDSGANVLVDITDGTLFTVKSTLDSDGNGQLTVQLDIPSADLVGTNVFTSTPHSVHVDVDDGDVFFCSLLERAGSVRSC